ncbi:MAG: restriction endonuclease subunit S [Deferribacterales bacterium]
MSHKLPDGWREESLSNITNIIVSNVDKKSSSTEIPVTLCNYMDVYNNSYIDKSLNFMTATATKEEINKFSLKVDDVLITKDSETPEDIAIPAVVSEIFDNFVCGYHLAILRPKNGLAGRFLNNILMSKKVHNHFVRFANGATRFGLTLDAIKKAKIPLPPIEEQRKIAEILGTVDEKISNIDQQISATETLKKGLMQKLFTEGIGHTEFKSTEIGTLPKSWEVRSIENIADVSSSKRIMKSEYVNEGIPFYRSKEIILKSRRHKLADVIYISNERFISLKEKFGAPVTGDILITAVGTIGVCYVVQEEEFYFKDGNLLWMRNISDNLNSDFLIYYFQTRNFKKSIEDVSGGSNQHALTIIKFNNVCLPLPPIEEQQKIASILTEVDNKIESLKKKKEKYTTLKTGLMQQLLTGQKRVEI